MLEKLAEWPDGPMAMKLPRQPGQKEARFAQLLSGEPAPEAGRGDAALPIQSGPSRVTQLEEELADLRKSFRDMQADFLDLKCRFEDLESQLKLKIADCSAAVELAHAAENFRRTAVGRPNGASVNFKAADVRHSALHVNLRS